MSLKTQASSGLKWQTVNTVARHVLSLVVFTTLARLVEPAAFGLIGLVAVYLTFANLLVDQGVGTALVQRAEVTPEHLNSAFWFSVAWASLLALTTILLADPIAGIFGEPKLAPLLRWASLILVMNSTTTVHLANFQRALDFRTPVLRSLTANVCGGVTGVSLALAGAGVWALVGQQLASSATGCMFYWLTSSWRPRAGFSWIRFRELFAVSSSVFGAHALWTIASRVDQLVIGRVVGAEPLGYYVVATRVCDLARDGLHIPIASVALPIFSRIQNDPARLRNAIYQGTALNALSSFAIFGGLATVGPTLVPLVLGRQWEPAVPMLQLLSVYGLVNGLLVFCHPALLASGGIGKYVVVNLLGTVGAISACTFGIRMGVPFLIVGLILNLMLSGFLALLFLRRRIGLSLVAFARPMRVPGIAAAAMYASITMIESMIAMPGHQSTYFMLQVLSGASIYIGCVWVLSPSSLAALGNLALQTLRSRNSSAST